MNENITSDSIVQKSSSLVGGNAESLRKNGDDIESQKRGCVDEGDLRMPEEGNAEAPSDDGGEVESQKNERDVEQSQLQARERAKDDSSSTSRDGDESHGKDGEEEPSQVTDPGQEKAKGVENIDGIASENRDLGVNHLWRDILPALDHAEFAYTVVEVRNAIRSGKVSDTSILHTPFSLHAMLKVIEENGHMLKDVTDQYETSLAKKQALNRLKNECLELGSIVTKRAKDILDGACDPISELPDIEGLRSGIIFAVVDDEKEKEEAVYHICVSHFRKCIYVVFRGSATAKDWAIDLKMTMKEVDNPIRDEDGLTKKVRIHAGFFEYLLEEGEEEKSKFNSICDAIKGIIAEHPDYQLMVTGHSLGAALSTLFAFYAASASDDLGISAAIKCINIGSPTVGNMDFRMAFQCLESRGKVRQLRIMNEGDPIPRMPRQDPIMGGLVNYFNQSYRYRHVGLCIMLYGKPLFSKRKEWRTSLCLLFNPFYWLLLLYTLIRFQKRPSFVLSRRKSHNKITRSFLDLLSDAKLFFLTGLLCSEGPWDAVKFHSVSRYRDRMICLREVFSKVTFEDLYSQAEQSRRSTLKIG